MSQDSSFLAKQNQEVYTEDLGSFSDSLSAKDAFDSNPFLDPATAKHWQDVYEESHYECREKFDPDFEWSEKEDKKLVRKLDLKVTFLACFMFVGLQIDRGNIKQAVSDTMLDDLGLTTNDYNYGNLISLASFLAAELPSGIISKKVGADRFIPFQMVAWSVVAFSQAFIKDKRGFYATRCLIALLEGGFIPDIVLWLSYFFKSGELSIRLSYFWAASSLTDVLAALLAFALFRLRGVAGMAGWRWLFLIEGLFTFALGITAYFLMVPSAVQTKKKWNPKGWFTDREEKIVVNRILRDDPSKGDMHNRQALTWNLFKKAALDFDLWPIYGLGIFAFQTVNVLGTYMTLNLKLMGFSTFHTNALTIPYNIIHVFTLLAVTQISVLLDERCWVILINPIWSIPCMAALAFWSGSLHERWPTWVVTTLALSVPYIHAINVAWCSRNANSIRTRTVSAAIYNMFVQGGSMISTQIYRDDDKPYYKRGNRQLFIMTIGLFFYILLVKAYYVLRNKHKQKKWDALTADQKEEYIQTTSDEGNKRLEFRFAH